MKPTESELRQIVEGTPLAMFRTCAGRILWANDAFARLLGYSHDELLAIETKQLYADPDERARLLALFDGDGQLRDSLEIRWRRKDGSPLWIQLLTRVTDVPELGKVFDMAVADISVLYKQREELQRTASTLDLVVGQLPAIYWLVDHELRIITTGGAIEGVLGYRPNLFVGRTLDFVHNYEPGSADPVAYHHRALAGDIVSYATEYRGKLMEVTLGPYRVDGKIIGVIGTAIDVTTARTLERRMVDAQRAESLGVLAGGLAHDFNNLLVAILGNADLALRDLPRGVPGRAEVENIHRAGRRAAELTDQLLAYAGRNDVATREVAPAPVVAELLRISSPTIPPSIAVHVDISPELAVRADPSQLRQAVLNLVGNAREALGANGGTIAITARAIRHDGIATPDDVLTASAGAYVVLEVADDGPGITHDARRRIFEPFFTTKSTGHGLGLAALLGIVRTHRGGLRVVSAPGEGAKFQVLWPAAERAPEVVVPAAAPTTRTVLVVDDEPIVRDVVARMIEDLGYTAVTAADGASALALLEARAIDLAIVDLSMPTMSGSDVIASIRKRRPELPVVLCSGYDRDRRGPVAADAYLPKPFQFEALERTLARLLTAARSAP